ncbi:MULTISPECIES: hypothetical protein [unclassified Bacillus cereus group]|uniref:hypothetical protein n=1 Tax=unclassified Bacillus cereus group TaxID=2750818 RepID=UPI001F56333E|nr:hypothetical protein [Bacillus cereus group sp. BfR-BA-01423]
MAVLNPIKEVLKESNIKYLTDSNGEVIIKFLTQFEPIEIRLKNDRKLNCIHFLAPKLVLLKHLLKKDRIKINEFLSYMNSGRMLYGNFGLQKIENKAYHIFYTYSVSLESRKIKHEELIDYISYIVAAYEKLCENLDMIREDEIDFDFDRLVEYGE